MGPGPTCHSHVRWYFATHVSLQWYFPNLPKVVISFHNNNKKKKLLCTTVILLSSIIFYTRCCISSVIFSHVAALVACYLPTFVCDYFICDKKKIHPITCSCICKDRKKMFQLTHRLGVLNGPIFISYVESLL